MASRTIVTDDCKRRTSPTCKGTFTYIRRPGRPPVACDACKAVKVTPNAVKTVSDGPRPTEGTCGCGNKFAIQPRGRISNRCEECRGNGTVWRSDDDGMVQMIQASQVAREEQERKDAAGMERATALTERMSLLLNKKNRTVIHH